MVSIFVTNEKGEKTAYEAVEGWTLMEILREYGLPIKAECGGACCCATCHVYLAEEWFNKLPPAGEEEEDMLDSAPGVENNSRLSCQIVINEDYDGLTLKIAEES